MARKIVEKLFKAMMTVVFSIIQVICLPLNALFNSVFPGGNFQQFINRFYYVFDNVLSGFNWAFGILPPAVRTLIQFILPIELALIPILRSTHLTSKAWNILQKLKFW